MEKTLGETDVLHQSWAEQSTAPDCLQRPLVPRSRFRQQVSASVRLTRATVKVDATDEHAAVVLLFSHMVSGQRAS